MMTTEHHPLRAVPLRNVHINGEFWGARQRTNSTSTLNAIEHQMTITGRFDALKLDWTPDQPKPHYFWDSDVAKWLEAVGYSLATQPDPALKERADAIVDLLANAQQPDGYLNSYFTAVEPELKWRNLRDLHELYCAGHLMEAAVAYADGTGDTKVLDVMRRYADLIDSLFGPDEGKRRGYCGHPEIELALVKLYHATGEQRYLDLARFFVDERGQQPHYFDIEAHERGDDPSKFWARTYAYAQAHVPIREQTHVVGHSVRALYLLSGVADVAAETNDDELVQLCRRMWDDLTEKQMYITGGLGPAHTNEGFTFSYDLPNETAYAETCASIALVFWAHRMFHIDPDSRYTDLIERALYNGILSGVSYDGKTFFYANPLASYPHVNPHEPWRGLLEDPHYRRWEWFSCACCPPNLARIVAGVGEYFYTVGADTLYVHLYGQTTSEIAFGGSTLRLEQTTAYPWDETIDFTLGLDQPARFTLALRIPGWCRHATLAVNGQAVPLNVERGYANVEREWSDGDRVTLTLAMPVERMRAHPKIRQDAGQIALQRGPVVYCLEEADNGADLANVVIPRQSTLTASFDADLFGGVSVITGEAVRPTVAAWPGGLYQPESALTVENAPFTFRAIPYFLWANREPGEMRVWLREE